MARPPLFVSLQVDADDRACLEALQGLSIAGGCTDEGTGEGLRDATAEGICESTEEGPDCGINATSAAIPDAVPSSGGSVGGGASFAAAEHWRSSGAAGAAAAGGGEADEKQAGGKGAGDVAEVIRWWAERLEILGNGTLVRLWHTQLPGHLSGGSVAL